MASARSMLVQVYACDTAPERIAALLAVIRGRLPQAVVVGGTSIGEIADGRTRVNSTVVGLTCFEHAGLHAVDCDVQGPDERAAGAALAEALCALEDVQGVLLLTTPLSLDPRKLLDGFERPGNRVPVFGGGAGIYDAGQLSVFHEDRILAQGAVAVAFTGGLEILARTYLGWKPLSRDMEVTATEGSRVLSVDHLPAFEVYRRYLGIPADDGS